MTYLSHFTLDMPIIMSLDELVAFQSHLLLALNVLYTISVGFLSDVILKTSISLQDFLFNQDDIF